MSFLFINVRQVRLRFSRMTVREESCEVMVLIRMLPQTAKDTVQHR